MIRTLLTQPGRVARHLISPSPLRYLAQLLAPFLEREPGLVLTDQYAPVDYLMAEVFRRR